MKKPWNDKCTGNREVKGVKNTEEETEKQNDWKKGDKFGSKGLWKVKRKNEVTTIMVQRAVGEDDVWKGVTIDKI